MAHVHDMNELLWEYLRATAGLTIVAVNGPLISNIKVNFSFLCLRTFLFHQFFS